MKKKVIYYTMMLLLISSCHSQPPFNTRRVHEPLKDQKEGNTYNINLTTEDCTVDIQEELGLKSIYKEEILVDKNLRKITLNSIPIHEVGVFPNAGNPNSIRAREKTYTIPLRPKLAPTITKGQGFETGILFSGVTIDPFTAEFFVGTTGKVNRKWNITTLTNTENLGLDCNNGHVQPQGKYHYHGVPNAYLAQLNADGSQMIKVGYAADGFPIYYKYGYDDSGKIIELKSGYELKKGQREGDGEIAPDGLYNGRYFNDYQFVEHSTLDECNGRIGKTPESEEEYYYVITDNFPSVPLCFSGSPNMGMRHGGGRNGGNHPPHRPRRGEHQHPH